MKFALMAFYLTAALTATAAQAGQVDLSTFTVAGDGSVSSNYAVVTGTSSLSGTVTNLKSFEWNFTAGDFLPFDDTGFFMTTSTGTVLLSSVSSAPYFDSTGWNTYTLATPYTGSVTFGVANADYWGNLGTDNNNPSQMEFRNAVTAVPEPETYAMLLAGLGLVGLLKRRKGAAA
jgi:hypothetical protein